MEDPKLQKLQALLKIVDESITRQEFIDSFKAVHDFVKRIEDKNNTELDSIKSEFKALSILVKEDSTNEVEGLKSQVNSLVNTHLVNVTKDIEKKIADIDAKLLEIKDGDDGEDGESVEIEEVISEVLNRIPEPPIDTPNSIANKLETLKGEDRLDAKAIKNLPEFIENKSQGSGLRNVFHDTTLTGTGTAVDPLKVVGGSGGSSTWGSITGTLSDQTDLQSALDAKQAIISLTTTGTSGAATLVGATLNIPQYQAAGTYVTSVSGTTNRITSSGGTTPVIDIAATYVGQSSITTLGTIGTGVWQGTTINYAYLGSGGVGTGLRYLADDNTWKTYAAGGGSVSSVASADGSITVTNPTSTVDLAVVKAPILTTARTIGTLTGDGTTAGSSFNGSANNTNALVLATVNSNVGTFGSATQVAQVTVNAKGLTTAVSNVTITPAIGSITGLGTGIATFLATPSSANLATAVTDETGSGALVFGTAPTVTLASASTAVTQAPADNSTKIATTAYVQAAIFATQTIAAAKYATTVALTATYSNGASGVGATLTEIALGALSVDGSTPSVNDRILVKNQASTFQNGVYVVTVVGSAGASYVLTRSSDYNVSADINLGDTIFVSAGSTLASTTWTQNGTENPVMGTDAITFAQTAGPGSYTAGNGLSLVGTQFAIDTAITVDKNTSQALTNKDLTSGTNTFPTFNQNTTGTAANATNSAITNDTTTNATMYPVWVTANTGNLPLKVSSTKLSFNPSTGNLTTQLVTIPSNTQAFVLGATGTTTFFGDTSDSFVDTMMLNTSKQGAVLRLVGTSTSIRILGNTVAGDAYIQAGQTGGSNAGALYFSGINGTAATSINFTGTTLNFTGTTAAFGTTNITGTGSLAATGARITKGWFTDVESTNMYTVGGTSLTTVAQTFQNKTLTNSNNVLGGVTMTLGSDASYDTYYRSSGGVLTRLANGTTGQFLGANTGAAPSWQTPSSGSCVTLIPQPNMQNTTGASATTTNNGNTTQWVYQFIIPVKIIVNKISFRTGTVSSAGTYDITIYSEDGQSQLIAVTTASVTSNAVITTAVSAVTLNPGIYWFGFNCNVNSTQAQILCYTAGANTGVIALASGVTSEPVISGTMTITGDTPATTFNPVSGVTTATLTNVGVVFRLDN